MLDFQEAFARLDEYIEQKMQADQIPGLALALTDRERLLRVSTYGFADLAAQTLVTPETLFAIASIGKSFTSIALLQEYEAGWLDLQAPVIRYLPWFAVQSAYEPITVHHLMSHTAGIIRGTDFAPAPRYEVYALRKTKTGSPPGQHFHYSNVGYKALGILLEEISGQPYGDLLQERINNPFRFAPPGIQQPDGLSAFIGQMVDLDEHKRPPLMRAVRDELERLSRVWARERQPVPAATSASPRATPAVEPVAASSSKRGLRFALSGQPL